MRPPRRPRPLSSGEARLWREVAKLVTPLRGRPTPIAEEPPAAPVPGVMPARLPGPAPVFPQTRPSRAPAPADKPSGHGVRTPPHITLPKLAPPKIAPPKIAPPKFTPPPPRIATAAPYQAPPQNPAPVLGLERQSRLALRRGRRGIEARLDLHGMVQSEAHAALTGFLIRSRSAGHTYVLIVTGKGGAGYSDPFGERGVLRRSVPHWLRAPDLRAIVHGFEEAARHHGGGGALYVRLRRR